MVESTFTIAVVLDPSGAVRGARQVQRGLRRVQGTVDKLRRLIRDAFLFVGFRVSIRQLTLFADTFLQVQNRLRVVTSSQAQLTNVTDELFRIARRTRSEFAATAELYTRLAINARELGRDQSELLQFTESLNQAIIISGASAKEANSGLIQLSQGLASGVLRGDELRSVLEQLPTVADTIAKELGITRGELRELGTQGKITSDIIIEAFLNRSDELAATFGKTVPTLAQAFVVLKNSVIEVIGTFERNTKTTEKLALIIVALADNFEQVARAAIFAGTALGVAFAKKGLNVATAAVQRLTAALLVNPLTAIPTLITIIIALLVTFADKITLGGGSLSNLRDIGVATFTVLADRVRLFVDVFTKSFIFIAEFANDAFSLIAKAFSFRNLALSAAVFVDTFVEILTRGFEFVLRIITKLPAALGEILITTVNALAKAIEFTLDALGAFVKAILTSVGRGLLAVTNAFRLLNSASTEFLKGNFELGNQLANDAVEQFNNNIKGAFTQLPGVFASNFKLAQADVVIPEIENVFAGAIVDLGDALKDSLIGSRLDITFAQDFVNDIFSEAERLASGRQIEIGVLGQAGEGGPGGPTGDSTRQFQDRLAQLKQEGVLAKTVLQLSSQSLEAGKARVELAKIEEEFRKDGLTLTGPQLEALDKQLTRTRQLTEQQALLEEIRGPAEEIQRDLETLNVLFASGIITIDEYNTKLRELNANLNETDKSFSGGFSAGLDEIQNQITDIASVTQNALVSSFNSAEDALANFIATGEFSFKEFARGIIADIAKIVARLLILQAIQFATGTGPIAAAGTAGGPPIVGPFFAEGGRVRPNAPIIVGEEGPEIFRPESAGQILPNDTTNAVLAAGRQQSQNVNVSAPPAMVQIVNVSDPDEIPSAIQSSEGEQAVLNVIQRNPRVVRRSIS